MIPEEKRWVSCEGPKAEKHIETKMIRYFELALYQSCKSRKKKKWFIEDSYLPLRVYLGHPQLSPSLHYFGHFVIKGRENKQIIFLYIHIVIVLPCIQHLYALQFQCYSPISMSRHWSPDQSTISSMRFHGYLF